ncbi:hypothetical protein K461DRAFT_250532 [Myriangium duriaei CBS 260.36]|uniref:T6SS Phospholipase effector Tle1-like catalytic domain-containing protein n=1 Tax=Myriangium duriaei CBS 260.36 TaxID=1168546 RepID=A0A9P4J8W7_9PEZI|nr:hypothetical protein K461DRAFT_250532 [Myriangium duriaei CBS 260.36]
MANRNDSATSGGAVYDRSFISGPVPPRKKRIIICCDGTWQSAVSLDPKQGSPSNVARISRVLARAGLDRHGDEWQQLVYYDAGVGTGNIGWYEKNRQGSLGKGLLENVIEAYNFIVNNYNQGDELFFFGFSRGAYTVRSTAGLVCTLGVIRPSSMRKFLKLYNSYTSAFESADKAPQQQFHEWGPWTEYVKDNADCYASKEVPVKVIGVFDTVGSLGVPDLGHVYRKDNSAIRKAYQFHDVELNDRIEHAYHALALDEQRSPFSPSVWKCKSGAKTQLCQVWFPGAHINIGGGSDQNADEDNQTGDREQLASISYAWMLDRVRPWLAVDENMLEAQKKDIIKAANYKPPPPPAKGWFRSGVDAVTVSNNMGIISDSHGLLYDVQGFPQPRTPGAYHDQNEYTVERIHPSVYFRQQFTKSHNMPTYVPIAMKDWERVYEKNGKGKDLKPRQGWMWKKFRVENGEKKVERALWEFEVGHMPQDKSMEKFLVDISWSKAFSAEVQNGWKSS